MLTEGSRRSREAIDAAYAEQRGGAERPSGDSRGQLILQVVFGVLLFPGALVWVFDGDSDMLGRVVFGILGLGWAIRGGLAARQLHRLRQQPGD